MFKQQLKVVVEVLDTYFILTLTLSYVIGKMNKYVFYSDHVPDLIVSLRYD